MSSELRCSNGCRAPVIGRGMCRPCLWVARRDGKLPKTWLRVDNRGNIVEVTETYVVAAMPKCACGRPSRRERCRQCYEAASAGAPKNRPQRVTARFRGESFLSPAQVLAKLDALDAAAAEPAYIKLELRRKLLAGVVA